MGAIWALRGAPTNDNTSGLSNVGQDRPKSQPLSTMDTTRIMTEQNIPLKFWGRPRGKPRRERMPFFLRASEGSWGGSRSKVVVSCSCFQLPACPSPSTPPCSFHKTHPYTYHHIGTDSLQDQCPCLPVPPTRPFSSAWRSSCGYVQEADGLGLSSSSSSSSGGGREGGTKGRERARTEGGPIAAARE